MKLVLSFGYQAKRERVRLNIVEHNKHIVNAKGNPRVKNLYLYPSENKGFSEGTEFSTLTLNPWVYMGVLCILLWFTTKTCSMKTNDFYLFNNLLLLPSKKARVWSRVEILYPYPTLTLTLYKTLGFFIPLVFTMNTCHTWLLQSMAPAHCHHHDVVKVADGGGKLSSCHTQ